MIEKIVMDYLNAVLDVPAYTEKPRIEPNEYVLIEKTGGGMEDFVWTATLAIQSYAETKYKAAELNEKVMKTMNNIVVLNEIGKSELNSNYDFTDTTKKKYRYQAVYELTY